MDQVETADQDGFRPAVSEPGQSFDLPAHHLVIRDKGNLTFHTIPLKAAKQNFRRFCPKAVLALLPKETAE
jgi:hypothetical protein